MMNLSHRPSPVQAHTHKLRNPNLYQFHALWPTTRDEVQTQKPKIRERNKNATRSVLKKHSKEMHWIICESWWKIICWPQANHLQFGKTSVTRRLNEVVSGDKSKKNTPFLTTLTLSVRVHLIGGFAVAHINYFGQQAMKAKHYKHLSLAPWFE